MEAEDSGGFLVYRNERTNNFVIFEAQRGEVVIYTVRVGDQSQGGEILFSHTNLLL